MVQYFKNLQQLTSGPSIPTRTLQTVYVGVDVWTTRRVQYGGGGYCCYRGITHTAPLGFSTALFAPGWTWELGTPDPDHNWDAWWGNERRLWLGPLQPGEIIPVPPSPEGPFKPMTAFFQTLPPPNPSRFVFFTSFSPGVGYSWFVEGQKVLHTEVGWTDIDKQTPLGNLVWPWPSPSWQGAEPEEAPPSGSTTLDMTDGYNGGNTLKLSLEHTGRKSDDTTKTIWLPIQSLTLTTRDSFEARLIYKTSAGSDVDVDAQIYIKPLSYDVIASAGFTASRAIVSALPRGWIQQIINFTSASTQHTASVTIGFLVSFKSKGPSAKVTFSFSLGQLAVYPTPPPPSVSVGTPSVKGAKFTPNALTPPTVPYDPLQGVVTWDTASTFAPIDVQVPDPESTTPAWLLQDTPAYRSPAFVYFNIYATPLPSPSVNVDPAQAVFIGTTGLDGRGNRFYTERTCFPDNWDKLPGVRFYVQGVTDRGDVLPWERCATVDHVRSS